MKKQKNKSNLIIEKAKNNKEEFVNFFRENNVAGLAIGIVVGNAVKDLVNAIVADLIMPIVGILTPNGKWREITFHIDGATFAVGDVLSSLVDFFIIALVAFIVIKKILRIGDNQSKL